METELVALREVAQVLSASVLARECFKLHKKVCPSCEDLAGEAAACATGIYLLENMWQSDDDAADVVLPKRKRLVESVLRV